MHRILGSFRDTSYTFHKGISFLIAFTVCFMYLFSPFASFPSEEMFRCAVRDHGPVEGSPTPRRKRLTFTHFSFAPPFAANVRIYPHTYSFRNSSSSSVFPLLLLLFLMILILPLLSLLVLHHLLILPLHSSTS